MTDKTVLVLGAAGRFGAAAVEAFAAAGWRVLAQARRAPAQPLPVRAEAVSLPLAETDAIVARAAGARAVVYAVNPVYTRWNQELLPLFRQGLEVARKLDARFMLPGNVYNYGESMPALLHEDTAERPSNAKGRLRCEMEAGLRAAPVAAVVIRAGDFFGAGRGSWLDQAIAKDLARGKLVYPGPLDRVHAWAYLPDFARAFVAVAEQAAAPKFQRLNFAGYPLTGAALLAAIEAAAADLGLAPAGGFRRGSLPWGLMRALGPFVPMWRELARMSYLWRVPHALDGAALERAVGRLPATPLAAALRRTLLDLGPAAGLAQRALSSGA
ncbi:MAG: NAD-dependent epimerase/dehydratase family protein [Burkholderiales bacterium]|nr:NAD-dependent epimerase/dehydratase family protein [Burkholderiales bacterium]MDE2394359.1 NAD-dependent epimerase/dehydratase family protein [Burkholderiales bacterium]MDE2452775.1 NAD-dependent epimerase/dehydratase family protein [Burkholderiales bacterium]